MANQTAPQEVDVTETLDRLVQRLQSLETRQAAAMTDALDQISRGVEALRRLQAGDELQQEVAALYEGVAQLRREAADGPDVVAEYEPPAPVPQAVLRAGDLPMTPGTLALMGQMSALKAQLDELEASAELPETKRPLDSEFRKELFHHWHVLNDEYETMIGGYMEDARAKYEVVKSKGKPSANAMSYWSGESLRVMNQFRTQLLVEKLFDPVELRVNQLKDSEYSRLLDRMTELVDLRRVAVVVGRTPFDERFHECVDINADRARDQSQVQVVNRVLLSGYMDKSDNSVVRKAFVKTAVRAVGETQNLRTTLTPSTPKPSAKMDTDVKSMTVSDLGEVLVPAEITSVKNRVTKLNGALSKVLGTDLPNELGTSVNLEVRSATMDLVARFYRQFSQFHERSKALAFLNYKRLKTAKTPDLTPASGWDEQMLYEYSEYRQRRLMEDCLDRVEEKIMQLGLNDHLPVLDLLAGYMEVARLDVVANQTVFDPDRHTIDSKMVTGQADLTGRPIVRLLLSGYVDLTTGKLMRKATVRVHV